MMSCLSIPEHPYLTYLYYEETKVDKSQTRSMPYNMFLRVFVGSLPVTVILEVMNKEVEGLLKFD
jgi:hypothetical protein